ncbi:lipopolysaccharide transport periplasmic protein LptA [Methylosoma difficile]
MKLNQLIKSCLWIVLADSYWTEPLALASDADQPITIDSNTATYDDVSATSTYTGNVISTQGSINILSDNLVIHFVEGEVDRLVFTGKKAKFRQMPNPGADNITGEALTGEYYPKKNLLVLIDGAIVRQGNTTHTSDLIEYDSMGAIVKAGEKTSDAKRVHSVFQPKQKMANNNVPIF